MDSPFDDNVWHKYHGRRPIVKVIHNTTTEIDEGLGMIKVAKDGKYIIIIKHVALRLLKAGGTIELESNNEVKRL